MIIPLNYTEFKGIYISSLEFCTKFWIQGMWRTAEYNLLLSHSVSCQLLSHFSFSWIFLMCLLSLSLLEIAFPRSSHLNHFSQSVLCQLLPFLILVVPIACPLSLSFAHAKSFSLPFSLSWMPISCGRPVGFPQVPLSVSCAISPDSGCLSAEASLAFSIGPF